MSEGLTEGRYANHFSVGHNALEFVLEFAQLYHDGSQVRLETRIVTLPPYAQALSQTLAESLRRYEQRYGAIPPINGVDTGSGLDHTARSAVDSEQGRLAMPDRPDRPDDTPSAGSSYEGSWQRDPPRRKPPREYEQDQYEGGPPPDPGYEPWQRPDYGTGGKPADELAGLKTKLEERQTEISTLSKQRDTLKQDIEGLEAAVTELTQIVAAHEQASKTLEKDKRDLDLYVATKTPMLEVAVKDKKEAIERIIEDANYEIEMARDRLDQLERDAADADQALDAAKQYADQEKAAYDALKDSYKQIEAKLKALKALRDSIEKDYDDKNKTASMYFLVQELKAELATIQILSKEELEQELYAAWNRLKKAKNALRDATAAQDAAKEAVAREKKNLETLVANRRKTILERIDALCAEQAG